MIWLFFISVTWLFVRIFYRFYKASKALEALEAVLVINDDPLKGGR